MKIIRKSECALTLPIAINFSSSLFLYHYGISTLAWRKKKKTYIHILVGALLDEVVGNLSFSFRSTASVAVAAIAVVEQ